MQKKLRTPTSFIKLVQNYGLETEVAIHLSNTYGDQADKVVEMGSLTGKRWPVIGTRLHEEFPYIEAEVKYAVKEYARTAVDILASLPEVDPNRMGAIGVSLGGHNSLFVGVFDTRLKVIVTSSGFDSFLDYMNGDPTGWCQTRYIKLSVLLRATQNVKIKAN